MKYVKPIAICFWLIAWQLLAMAIHNSILLVGPVEVGKALLSLCGSASFYQIVGISLLRIMAGFFAACIVGVLLGIVTYTYRMIREFVEPLLHVMKSIPVASFVVLLLIWQGSKQLSFWISFLVVLPGVCISVRSSLEAVDAKMLEMAKVYDLSLGQRIRLLYKPTFVAYFLATLESHIGMAFKSGVAAEIIGQPNYAIGERIYISKVYLDTAGVFAWTLTLIVVSVCVEKALLYVVKKGQQPARFVKRRWEKMASYKSIDQNHRGHDTVEETGTSIDLLLHKSYGDQVIFDQYRCRFDKGGRYVVMAPSGRGKTTMFRMLSGLEACDAIDGDFAKKETDARLTKGLSHVSYLFQEDRLAETEYVITNLCMDVWDAASKARIEDALSMLSLSECVFDPVASQSGGMKRRIALIRAMLYQYDNPEAVVLLDEPFNGLDDTMRQKAADFILKYQNGRTMLIASHQKQDVELLQGELFSLA